jgi:predicted permease
VDVIQDVRYTARLTRKSPGFSLCVVTLLALAIGLNTSIFTLLDALLLRRLPVKKPAELVRLLQVSPRLGPRSDFTYNAYRALFRYASSFTSLFGYNDLDVAVRDAGGAHRVRCQIVTGSFFTALGVNPLYGRVLTPADELYAANSLPVVLSYSYWMGHFGGDPSVVNRGLTVQERPFVIAGVMPESFNGVQLDTSPEIRVPLIAGNQLLHDPDVDSYTKLGYTLVARLRPGVSAERARSEAEAIVNAAIEEQFHDQNEGSYWRLGQFQLQPIANGVSLLRPKFSSALTLLMGGGALLLLMICANIGGLLLARTAARRGEIALRLAIGATGARLARQWITETLLLATCGGVAGLCLAFWATPLVARTLPPLRDFDATPLTLSLNLKPDTRVLVFSFLLCVISALLAGFPGALQVTRTDLHSALKAGRATPRQALRWTLVAFQVALCTVLLAGCGLLISTFRQLRTLDPGFDRDHVVTFSLDPGMLNYTPQQAGGLRSRLLATVRELPGVQSAGIASRGVMRGTGVVATVAPAGKRVPRSEFLNTSLNQVSPEYFETMGMRFLSGRNFRENEPKTKPAPVVVNHAFVRHFFVESNAVGEKFGLGNVVEKAASADYQIIGVVSDAKYRSLREMIPPTIYRLWLVEAEGAEPFILHVRTRNRPDAIIGPVESALRTIDPRLPFFEIHTLAEEVDATLWAERVLAWLSTIFAIAAAVLATMGVYATLAYAIAQGRREIGIRMALGARPVDLARLLAARPMLVASMGVAAGTVAFQAVSSLFRNVLFGVSASDPLAVIGGAAIVLAITLITTLIAVNGAIRVSPASVLREE